MSRSARALWVVERERAEIRTEELAEPGPGEVLVKTEFSAVSRGTESLIFRGGVPASEFSRMRAPFQVGQFPWPVKYGYSNVGRVVDGSPDLLGRSVFCLFPHQTAYVVPAEAVFVLPDDVPSERAVLSANLETALNAIWDAELRAGDRVVVVGAGVVGALVAHLAGRHPGTEVQLVDVDAARAEVAAELGVAFALSGDARTDADVVFHASGAPSGLETALLAAGTDATVVEMSWFGDRPVTVNLGAAFHSRRLRLQSSQVGQLPPLRRPRWSHARRLRKAMALLADPRLDCLISGESPFDELPRVLERFAAGQRALCHRIRY